MVGVGFVGQVSADAVALDEARHLSPVYIVLLCDLCPFSATRPAGVTLFDDRRLIFLESPDVTVIIALRAGFFNSPSYGHDISNMLLVSCSHSSSLPGVAGFGLLNPSR